MIQKSSIIFFFLVFNAALSQSNSIEIINDMFKWKFSIPNYFENVSPEESTKNLASGKKFFEESIDQEIVNKSIKIYGFKSGDKNQLIVNFQPTTKSIEAYHDTFEELSEILYSSFKERLPEAEISHSLSTEIISNVKFEVFDMTIVSNNINMTMKLFATIRFNKILNIQVAYKDDKLGQDLISAIRNSDFTN